MTNSRVFCWNYFFQLIKFLSSCLVFQNYFGWYITSFCKILNWISQFICFICNSIEQKSIYCKEVRLGLERSNAENLTPTSNPIHPPSKNLLAFILPSVNFDSKIHHSPTLFMLSSILLEMDIKTVKISFSCLRIQSEQTIPLLCTST